MKLVLLLVVSSYVLMVARGFPRTVFSSSGNVDTWSQGDSRRGGLVLSRIHDPTYIRRAVRGSLTTYSLRQPYSVLPPHLDSERHQADRRCQTLLEVNDTPPQENEVYYPQDPETPTLVPVEATELIHPAEPAPIAPTTAKAIISEPTETAILPQEEPVPQTKKVVKKKPTTAQSDEEEYDDDSYSTHPKFPSGVFFPMFFGWGGSGPTAIANAYSTGRGGAAASEARAYGNIRPLEKV